jgi:hypothetical protein
MRTISLRKFISSMVIMCIAPAAWAATASASLNRRSSFENTQAEDLNYREAASTLLSRVRKQAYQIQDEADELRAVGRTPGLVSWQTDASYLARIRTRVNAMDRTVQQLREISNRSLPWQRRAIAQVAPAAYELTGYTEAAIDYLNGHQNFLWNSKYRSDARGIFARSGRVENVASRFEEFAADAQQAHKLGRELGLKVSS